MDMRLPTGFAKIRDLFLRWISARTSRNLAITALVLWCCSLLLTVFYTGGDSTTWYGLQILLIGWLGLLMPSVGWYANIFFLWSLFRLLAGKKPVASILLAVLLALDSLRISSVPTGPGETGIYGYGWGIVLWFLSIFLLLAAVGKRRRELAEQEVDRDELLFPAGLILCGVALTTTLYFAVHDRMIAAPIDAKRLANISKVAFKRLPVCSASYPAAAEPMRQLSGPVEIVPAATEAKPGPIEPFDDARTLLSWGIPVIRFGGADYSYGLDGTILAVPAVGQPVAILTAGERKDRSTVVRLVEVKSNRLVFEQSWEKDGKLQPEQFSLSRICSEYRYSSYPGQENQPRQLVMQALGLPDLPYDLKTRQDKQEKNTEYKRINIIYYEGSIVAQEDGELSKEMYPMNNNCPVDVGLGTRRAYKGDGDVGLGEEVVYKKGNGTKFEPSNFFQIKQKKWYWSGSDFPRAAFCDGVEVYLLRDHLWADGFSLIMEQRNLDNFQMIWAGTILLSKTDRELAKDRYFVPIAFSRDGEIVNLRLVDRKSGQIFTVRATPKQ